MNKILIIKINKFILALIIFFFLLLCVIIAVKQFKSASIVKEACINSLPPRSKIAIIIDDFGQNRAGVSEMMSIQRHLTFAIMPFLAFSQSDASNAYKTGHEVLVHLPMESIGLNKKWLGPNPIMTSMSTSEVQKVTLESIEDIPYAKGINIHMGSKAGDDKRVISEILDIVKLKNLYFVDSRASRNPIANKISKTKNVICFDRDVFIDGNKKDKNYVKKQLDLAAAIAIKKGYSIAIGHVGAEGGKTTANAIFEKIPDFDGKNIELVYVSELFRHQNLP